MGTTVTPVGMFTPNVVPDDANARLHIQLNTDSVVSNVYYHCFNFTSKGVGINPTVFNDSLHV